MKKLLMLFLLTFSITFLHISFVQAAPSELYYDGGWHDYDGFSIGLKVNGQEVNCEMPPIIFGDFSLVPARDVFEKLGAVVSWNSIKDSAEVTYKDTTVTLKIGSTTAYVNGEAKTLDIAPKIINDKTMIPTRFVGEQLGFYVVWGEQDKTIYISNKIEPLSINDIKFVSDEKNISAGGLDGDKVQIDIAANIGIEKYKSFTLENPYRLVIDINSAMLNVSATNIPISQNGISQVRMSQFSTEPNITRIVIDFDKETVYKIHASGDRTHLYIDVAKNDESTDDGKHTVVIDPGHGGKEPGATYSGEKEKNINFDIAVHLKELLVAEGIEVVMTRSDDSAVDLYERSGIANRIKADLLISIHNNAMEDDSFDGTMTLYYPDDNGTNKGLAQIIQEQMLNELGTSDRGVRSRPDLAVLRTSEVPTALVEVAFMTNATDMENLKSEEFRQNAAKAIKDGIVKYLNKK